MLMEMKTPAMEDAGAQSRTAAISSERKKFMWSPSLTM
jgi:hypothetical protein